MEPGATALLLGQMTDVTVLQIQLGLQPAGQVGGTGWEQFSRQTIQRYLSRDQREFLLLTFLMTRLYLGRQLRFQQIVARTTTYLRIQQELSY